MTSVLFYSLVVDMVQPLKRSNMSLTFNDCFLVGGPGSLRHGDEEGKA